MNLVDPFIGELEYESKSTHKMLERLPVGSLGWSPHPKSMSLGRLAGHLCEIPAWLEPTINSEELDFAVQKYEPYIPSSIEDLVQTFDSNIENGLRVLKDQTDEHLLKSWRLRMGEQIIFEMPRIAVLRGFVLKHLIHHRGQMSVYIRLLDIPVPAIYGPSADES